MPLEDSKVSIDNAVASQFHTQATTRMLENSHHMKWTIENVAIQPEGQEIMGPDFTFTRIKMNISIVIWCDQIQVLLKNTSAKTINLKSKYVFLDCEGTELAKIEKDFQFIEGNKYLPFYAKFPQSTEACLKSNKLIVISSHISLRQNTTKTDLFYSHEKCTEKLLNDFKILYENCDYFDFSIKVGDDFIPTHKAILSLRSAFFKTFLEIRTKEKIDLIVEDASLNTMRKLVEFLYTGNFTLKEGDDKVQELINLYVAADTYKVKDLRSFCANQLIFAATVDNILEILQLSACHSDENLKIEAINIICFHFKEILKLDAWKTFLEENVDLAIEVLNACFKDI